MFSQVRMSEDKVCTKDTCWFMETLYNHRELSKISTAGPGLDGVLRYSIIQPHNVHIKVLLNIKVHTIRRMKIIRYIEHEQLNDLLCAR
jgi:hypothetical protein